MNTLYIHGLDSSPKVEKTNIINAYSPVEALHLDYRKQPDSFEILSKLIIDKKISHIIGSSLGGYLGFWLAEEFGLPCLLFNPAIGLRSIELNIEVDNRTCPYRLIVIGEKDDVVIPKSTLLFLKKHKSTLCKQRIITCNDLAHQIDLDTFKEFTDCFYVSVI